jgi:holo-[acyl-carrier protein] synthase
MIVGIGVDTATVSRVEKSMQNPRFLNSVFGPEERALFAERGMRAQTVAANFAAKEALGKALGEGLSGFAWQEAQTLRNERGAPYWAFSGALEARMAAEGWRVHVSLTHEGDSATAFVVVEQLQAYKEEREQ